MDCSFLVAPLCPIILSFSPSGPHLLSLFHYLSLFLFFSLSCLILSTLQQKTKFTSLSKPVAFGLTALQLLPSKCCTSFKWISKMLDRTGLHNLVHMSVFHGSFPPTMTWPLFWMNEFISFCLSPSVTVETDLMDATPNQTNAGLHGQLDFITEVF